MSDKSRKVEQSGEDRKKTIIKDGSRANLAAEKRNVMISTEKPKPSTVDVDKTDKSIIYPLGGKQQKTFIGEGHSIVQVDEEKKKPQSGKSIASATGAKGKQQTTKDIETITLTHKTRGTPVVSNKVPELHGTVQWKAIMRKFSQAHKETCKTVPRDIPTTQRSKKNFPTGSTYAGSWNALGMSGQGTYEFPHEEVVYEGEFDDGMFHGEGELRYACGAIMKGKWNRGKVFEKRLIFADGLEYDEDEWSYLRYPDRRFTIEYDQGLEPAGLTFKTAEQPPPLVPPGYYDVGDGFYLPETKTVYKYDDITAIVRSPEEREQQWIVSNCRTCPATPQGPLPHVYERWAEATLEAEVSPPAAARTKTFPDEETDEDPFAAVDRPRGGKINKIKAFDSRKGLASATDFYRPDMISNISTNTSNTTSSTAFKRMRKFGNKEETHQQRTVNTCEQSVTDYVTPVNQRDPASSTCGLYPKSVINW